MTLTPSPPESTETDAILAAVAPTPSRPTEAVPHHVDYDRSSLAVEQWEHYIDLQMSNDRFRIRL
ncbi:MAG TPA: hypothetical protein VGO76_12905 [Luteibacter sp.]|nr:hypothetical protein [Luteibacter sp.]